MAGDAKDYQLTNTHSFTGGLVNLFYWWFIYFNNCKEIINSKDKKGSF
jgi:hypothetical protein